MSARLQNKLILSSTYICHNYIFDSVPTNNIERTEN